MPLECNTSSNKDLTLSLTLILFVWKGIETRSKGWSSLKLTVLKFWKCLNWKVFRKRPKTENVRPAGAGIAGGIAVPVRDVKSCVAKPMSKRKEYDLARRAAGSEAPDQDSKRSAPWSYSLSSDSITYTLQYLVHYLRDPLHFTIDSNIYFMYQIYEFWWHHISHSYFY